MFSVIVLVATAPFAQSSFAFSSDSARTPKELRSSQQADANGDSGVDESDIDVHVNRHRGHDGLAGACRLEAAEFVNCS